jgi:hypothetical protein
MANPKLTDNVAQFLGGTIKKDMRDKLEGWTFEDLKNLDRAFDKLPPNKRGQVKGMCCCSMCCCAAAVTSMNKIEEGK